MAGEQASDHFLRSLRLLELLADSMCKAGIGVTNFSHQSGEFWRFAVGQAAAWPSATDAGFGDSVFHDDDVGWCIADNIKKGTGRQRDSIIERS
jgi:hypothetical protein